MSLIGHDSSWLRAAFTDTAVSGQRSSQEMVLQCWTHPRVPKELRKHDRAGLGKSQTYGRMKPKKSGKINDKRRLANNYHGTLGGNYITRGLQELKRFFEVKVLLNQLSYEETVHMFSFKKWNDKWKHKLNHLVLTADYDRRGWRNTVNLNYHFLKHEKKNASHFSLTRK